VTAAVTRLTTDTPLTAQFARERAEFEAGYIAGYHVGHELGVRHGEAAEARLWSEALGALQQTANLPLQAELEARRADTCTDPCPTRCRQCSRCVRSLAYWGRGGRDFAGAEQEKAQIRAALAASAQRARTAEAAGEANTYGLAAGG